MRWHPEKNNITVVAEVPELWYSVALIIVQDKQAFATNAFHSSIFLKVMNPLNTNRISNPAIWTNSEDLC